MMVAADALVDKRDTFLALSIAVAVGITIEILAFFFVYSYPDFQQLHSSVCKLYRKMLLVKELGKEAGKKSKLSYTNLEKEYQRKNKLISAFRTRVNLMTGVLCMVLLPLLYSLFDGVAVARLPFIPPYPISFLTHAGLAGDDFSECSVTCFCMIALLLTRQNLQRILGYAPPATSTNTAFAAWAEANSQASYNP